ncbi:MAG TPA: hypothetical protein VLA37_04285 [Sphingomonadaceae bacterium]|nr:hypothetical protein [Sphingomonadaceae bacterium]
MKKLILIAGVLAIAGCQAEPVEEPVVEEPEPAAMVTANGSPAGVYDATAPDGTVTTSTLNADGTYTDTDASGAVIAEGTWAVTDGKTCFSPTTEGATAMCYTETAPGADGSFTATPDEGDPVTVTPHVAVAETPAA